MNENIERKFGYIPSEYDGRDYKLRNCIPPIRGVSPVKRVWDFPVTPLDQETSVHCVGFCMAHFGINLPTFTLYNKKDAHEFYYKCKVVEDEPKIENGAQMRSAAKVLQDEEVVNGYAFAHSLSEIKWWLLNRGPIMIGTIWTSEMMLPKPGNILSTGGDILGGHAYLLNEWREDGYIGIQNSWGSAWGEKGKAYIKAEDLEKLFWYGGEAIAAIEIENYNKMSCKFLRKLLNKIIEFLNKWFL